MNTITIPLTKGKVAVIDEADYNLVSQYKWHASFNRGHWYAVVNRKAEGLPKLYMHRLIADAPRGRVVDHIDGDGLNNTQGNLRVCRHAQNIAAGRWKGGGTGYIGVCFDPTLASRPYQAYVTDHCRKINLGRFATPEEAARIRDTAAIRLHGEFARLNFPSESSVETETVSVL